MDQDPNRRTTVHAQVQSTTSSLTMRIAALQAAATFAAGRATCGADIRSADVLKVAEAFERWLLDSAAVPT